MKKLFLVMLMFLSGAHAYAQQEIKLDADAFRNFGELNDAVKDLARGNRGTGEIVGGTLSWDTASVKLSLDAKLRHRHKTNGFVIYDIHETISASIVLRDCKVEKPELSSTGFLTSTLFHNQSFIRRLLKGLVEIPKIAIALPEEFSAACAPEITEPVDNLGSTITPGAILTLGDSMHSPDGRFSLYFQEDSNLVLNHNGVGVLWSSGTVGTMGYRILFQPDGNLVMITESNTAVWSTDTFREGAGVFLTLQDDGNLIIYRNAGGAAWSTNTCCR